MIEIHKKKYISVNPDFSNHILEFGRQKERRLKIGRIGLFFADFLSNIQVFACKIVKNYSRWGQCCLRRLLPPRLRAGLAPVGDREP